MSNERAIIGKSCRSAALILFSPPEGDLEADGSVEFAWTDGSFTLVEANSDWTASMSHHPWEDPYKDVSTEERVHIASSIGILQRVPPLPDHPLRAITGQQVSDVEPMRNEVGEVYGFRVTTDCTRLELKVYGGDIVTRSMSPDDKT